MRVSQLNPIEVQTNRSGNKNSNDKIKDCIVVGKCEHDIYYESRLTFPPILINDDEVVQRAVLKMFCKRICGIHGNINICINKNNVCSGVEEIGAYEWDVTNLVKGNEERELKLYAYTNDQINCCSIKEFEVFNYTTKPVLEITFTNTVPQTKHKVVDIVKECWSDNILRCTEWIDSIWFDNYYYFIKNFGTSDVEIVVEISPDKQLIFQDSEPLMIKANEVSYFQAMRPSQFVRLSYKNVSLNSPNLIKVWLQGQR